VLNGSVTLEVFTQSINKAQVAAGKLCVYLFKRHETGSPPVATDTMLTNTLGGTPYWTYFEPSWTTELKPKILNMPFTGAPYTIPAGDRLGVAFSVERQSTGGDGLSFMYDHPQAPTRIEVDTSTPIDGG